MDSTIKIFCSSDDRVVVHILMLLFCVCGEITNLNVLGRYNYK